MRVVSFAMAVAMLLMVFSAAVPTEFPFMEERVYDMTDGAEPCPPEAEAPDAFVIAASVIVVLGTIALCGCIVFRRK